MLIQGLRRIADLAKIGVLGVLLGAIFSIVLVYFLGEPGVAPSLVVAAAHQDQAVLDIPLANQSDPGR